jgi:hypothetical protein
VRFLVQLRRSVCICIWGPEEGLDYTQGHFGVRAGINDKQDA